MNRKFIALLLTISLVVVLTYHPIYSYALIRSSTGFYDVQHITNKSKITVTTSGEDWIISDYEYITDQTLILNKSLRIIENGSLTLENVTLIFDSQTDVGIGLEVLDNGQLILKNVTISPKTYLLHYYICLNTTGTILIKDSEISGVGSLHASSSSKNGFFVYNVNGFVIENSVLHVIYPGLHIKNSKNVQIKNSEIFSGFAYGLSLTNCSNMIVTGNEFYYNTNQSLSILNSSDVSIFQNNISHTSYGIYIERSSGVLISANNISDCNLGVYLASSTNVNIDNNLLFNNDQKSIEISDSQGIIQRNTIYHSNIYVHGSRVGLQNLTITSDNLVNDYPVYFGFNLSNEFIRNGTYGEIIIVYSNQVYLQNIQTSILEIYGCENISVESTLLGYNVYTGLHIELSTEIIIERTNITSAEQGLYIVNSSQIYVEQTKIENCSFAGAYILQSSSVFFYNGCISDSWYGVLTVTSFKIKLTLLKAERNYNSIRFMYTHESTIEQSYIALTSFNGKGVYVLYSNDILINNNTITNCFNNIYLWTSNNTHVINNTLLNSSSFGLVVASCLNTTLSGNQIMNSSIYVIGSDKTFGTIFSSNDTVANDHPMLVVFNQTNLSLANLRLEYLLIAFCENISIVNSTIKSIQIYSSTGISINKTIVATVTTYGIYVDNSYNCTIANNTIRDKSDVGIYIVRSWNTIVFRNIICNNNLGIYVYAHQTLIYQNAFIGNVKHAEDMGVSQWDDGLVGNYWSDFNTFESDLDRDGILTTTYTIPGRNVISNQDNYPLAFPLLDYDDKPPVLLFLNITKWTTRDAETGRLVKCLTITINATDEHPIRLIEICIPSTGITAVANYNPNANLYIIVDEGDLPEMIWNNDLVNITVLLVDIYENKVWYHLQNYTSNLTPQEQEALFFGYLILISLFVLILLVCVIAIVLYIRKTRKKSEVSTKPIILNVPLRKNKVS